MIPENDYKIRITNLMSQLVEYTRVSRAQIDEMFELYNDRLTPRENGKFCGSCTHRVYKRLKKYFEDNYGNTEC